MFWKIKEFILPFIFILALFSLFGTHIQGGVIQIKEVSENTVTFEFVAIRDRGSQIELGGGVFDFGDQQFVERNFEIKKEILDNGTELVSFTLVDQVQDDKFYFDYLGLSDEGKIVSSQNIFYTPDCEAFTAAGSFILEAKNNPEIHPMIYPNPSTGRFKIDNISNLSSFKIVSLIGNLTYKGYLVDHSVSLTLNNQLSKGVYLLQFFDDLGRLKITDRLVIVEYVV